MTSKINFTKTEVMNLPLPEKGKINYYYDKQVNGLGLMLFASGTRTFFLYKRINGRPDKVKLGRFPEISVEQARKAAYSAITDIAKGINPKDEKIFAKKVLLFSELFNEYMDKHARLHKKCWREDNNAYRVHLTRFYNKKINNIFKGDIIELQANLLKNSGLYSANRVLALLTTIFNKAIEWGFLDNNPCIGIKKFREKSRDRFIQDDEIPRFFEALNNEPNETFKDFFYICLLTGARRSNVQAMNWQDINLERAEWYIRETKNGESQTIPLIPQALEILRPRLKNRINDWVFPSETSKSGHIEEPKTSWNRILKSAQIEDLRIHDLRRTLGSWQAATGANSFIIGKSLGHKDQQSTAIYARLNLDPVRTSVGRAVDAMFNTTLKKD
ncbi:site-specific integrase [Holosporaceae bacterium 'Namur']|nr:site-specific integrase [Holosporaceae bacterium 'Namur']